MIARHIAAEIVVDAAAELIRSGLPVVEITLDSEEALESIARLRSRFGEQVCLGAGTALAPRTAQLAVDEGIDFLVSPVADEGVAEVAHKHEVAYIPGAATTTEVWRASMLSASAVKLFPFGGRQAGVVRAIASVLPDVTLMCSGGVDDSSVAPLLDAGATLLGVGSWLWASSNDEFAHRVARLTEAVREHEQGIRA